MNEPRVGVTLSQFTDDASKFTGAAERARAANLDSIWVFDHLWPLGGPKDRPFIECWTALAWLAAATRDVGIGTMVTRSTLRHPAVLGKMAATVANVAPGRLTVTIGSGDAKSRAENEAFGLPYWSGRKRIAELASTVEAVHRYVTDDVITMRNQFVSLTDLPTSPRSVAPPIWVGGASSEVRALAASKADGWNGWQLRPEDVGRATRHIRSLPGGARTEVTWGGLVYLEETDDAATRRWGRRATSRTPIGGPSTVAARLADLAAAGASHLIVTFPNAGEVGPFERLGGEVVPALRRMLSSRAAYPGGV